MSASSSFVLHCVVVCVFCLQSVQTQRLLFRPFLASVIADVNYLVLSPVAGLSLPTSNLVLLSVTPLLLACHCRQAISFCYLLLHCCWLVTADQQSRFVIRYSIVAGLSLPTNSLVLLSVTPLLLACHCRPAISFCCLLLHCCWLVTADQQSRFVIPCWL